MSVWFSSFSTPPGEMIELQARIDAGGTINLPAGTYTLDEPLSVPENVPFDPEIGHTTTTETAW